MMVGPVTLTTVCCSKPDASKLYGLHLHLHKIRTQCEPDYLQMWSERSDHNPISTHLHPACVFPHLDNLCGYRSHFNARCLWGVRGFHLTWRLFNNETNKSHDPTLLHDIIIVLIERPLVAEIDTDCVFKSQFATLLNI